MIIGIYGIAGVYNLGCEAIVRGTVKNLKKIYPEAHFIYYSEKSRQDKEALKDLPIEIKQIVKKNLLLKRVVNKIFRIIGLNYQIIYDDYKTIIKEVDCIVSVGGDIYTIPRFSLEQDKYYYYNRLVHFGEKVIKNGKKYIIYGASIGPFGKNPSALAYYQNHFKKVDLIVTRDNETVKYLSALGIEENVIFLPDPAFSLRVDLNKKNGKKNKIGINLSGLSVKETFGVFSDESVKQFAKVIEKLIEISNKDILFIPHVFSENAIDNDYYVLNEIRKSISYEYKNRISIVSRMSFVELKKELSDCCIVISARMHCAINAMSEGVPTVLLSYSRKAIGMGEFAYNSQKWVYDIREINDSAFIDLVIELLTRSEEISSLLVNNLKTVLDDSLYREEEKKIYDVLNNDLK